jgi:hypothetical protein
VNNYFSFSTDFVPFTRVRANALNQVFEAIETAFDNLPTDTSALTRGTSTVGIESGSANSFVVTMDPPRLSNQNGDLVSFLATHGNTGAATLNVDGLGAIALRRSDGSALTSADIATGLWYTARYDSANTRFLIQGPLPGDTAAAAAAAAASASAAATSASAASTSAGNASTSASAAATSASGASTSATNAANSASLAQEWAENDQDVAVTGFPGQFSARHWALEAQDTFADAAFLSAANVFTQNQQIAKSSPRFSLRATDQAVDEEQWNIEIIGNQFQISPASTGGSSVGAAIAANRSGTTVTTLSYTATTHTFSGTTFQVAGSVLTDNSSADEVGFKGIPSEPKTEDYTCVLSDAARCIRMDGTSLTATIPSNASVPYPVGTVLTFLNINSSPLSIAINSDTLALAGTSTTGTRTLAFRGMATAYKYTNLVWVISGPGLS